MVEVVVVFSVNNLTSKLLLQPVDISLISQRILLANQECNRYLRTNLGQANQRDDLGAVVAHIVIIVAVIVLPEHALRDNLRVVEYLLGGGAALGHAVLESPCGVVGVGRLDVEPGAD